MRAAATVPITARDPMFAPPQPLDGATFTGTGTNMTQVRAVGNNPSHTPAIVNSLTSDSPPLDSRFFRSIRMTRPPLRGSAGARQVTAWARDVDFVFFGDHVCSTYKASAPRLRVHAVTVARQNSVLDKF